MQIEIQLKKANIHSHRYTLRKFNSTNYGNYIKLGKFNEERSENFAPSDLPFINAHKEDLEYIVEAYDKREEPYGYCLCEVKIGKRTEISKEELYELMLKENPKLTKKDFKNMKFMFTDMYPCAYHDMNINYTFSKTIEEATNLIANKSNIEFIIKNLSNSQISDIEYINKIEKNFSVGANSVNKAIVYSRFKQPKRVQIKTNIKGSPSLEVLGTGSDFSYVMHDTTKNYYLYVEENTEIDVTKTYTSKEFINLLETTNALCANEWGQIENVSEEMRAKVIRENLTKAQLLEQYMIYQQYYKIAKADLSVHLQQLKSERVEKIKEYKTQNKEGDKALKELEKNQAEKEL